MDRNICDHNWTILREAGPRTDTGHGGEMYPAVCQCANCGVTMTTSEAMQLSAVKNQTKSLENQTKLANHQLGFEKWRSIIALIFSGIAIVISILTFLYSFIWKA